MAKRERTPDDLMETETTIRWDDSDSPAVLWTASAKVRKEWEGFGFKPVPTEYGRGGWRVEVPKDRVSYKPLKVTQK